jgi:hypothetical protein
VLKDSRPISLCNVIYKVVSKFLVNRLRPLLQGIISPMHRAFILDRLITDNALIAFECLHAIHNDSNDCKRFGAYKLDPCQLGILRSLETARFSQNMGTVGDGVCHHWPLLHQV